MTTKQWLMRARHLENRIAALLDARQRAYDRAVSTTAHPRDVCVIGGNTAAPDDKAASYVIVDEEVRRQEAALNRIRAEILDVIGLIEDNTLAALLTKYYVNGETWEQVAVDMNFSYSHVVQNLHPRALAAAKECIEVYMPDAL